MTTIPAVVSAEGIDGSFVPVGRDTVASVEIDGEVVLLDGSTGVLRNLDPVAGIVWGCFDATGTIDEIVADLCAEFGADPSTVRSDVIELARTLAREGLLGGVASENPKPGPRRDGPAGSGHKGHGHGPAAEGRADCLAPDPAAESTPVGGPASEPRFLEEPPSS